jgi:hypothetical protein
MISKLAELAHRLNALMQDPHPGLSTWHGAVGRTLNELAELAPTKEER